MKIDQCRSCGRNIYWLKTSKGKLMPVDTQPSKDGNIVIEEGIATVVSQGSLFGEPLYTSHFATCPQAPSWRKK